MRLYLSSFRVGNCPEQLVALTRGDVRTAVIANAMDGAPPEVRLAAVERELTALADLALEAEELDLRTLRPATVSDELNRYDVVWLRGGNAFMLRHALAESGADCELTSRLENDSLVYAGYSAGPCVLGPSLRGLEAADDPGQVEATHGRPPIWDGLGVLDFSIVPHVDSPNHPPGAVYVEVHESGECRPGPGSGKVPARRHTAQDSSRRRRPHRRRQEAVHLQLTDRPRRRCAARSTYSGAELPGNSTTL